MVSPNNTIVVSKMSPNNTIIILKIIINNVISNFFKKYCENYQNVT